MGLDTKYRPQTFEDVLGQESAMKVIKRFVETGQGFQQSYLFCGPYGSGKTTLGRILARALLCDNPDKGNPCDACDSCLSMLSDSHECFIEVDAATNSGKAEMKQVTSELDYSSFSGKRTLYLFDECFTEDTTLLTREGYRSIRWLVETQYQGEVLSYDPILKVVVWQKVINWFDLGDRDVVTLNFDNGVEITVTLEQELNTHNRGWVKAINLTEEDDVIETQFTDLTCSL